MLTLTRFTKMVLLTLFVAGFFVSACHAETMATYSGKYALDLEQKQMLLDSIKEDAEKTGAEVKDNVDMIKAADDAKTSTLRMENINLVELMPSVEKINVAFTATNHMLSPESGLRIWKKSEARSRR